MQSLAGGRDVDFLLEHPQLHAQKLRGAVSDGAVVFEFARWISLLVAYRHELHRALEVLPKLVDDVALRNPEGVEDRSFAALYLLAHLNIIEQAISLRVGCTLRIACSDGGLRGVMVDEILSDETESLCTWPVLGRGFCGFHTGIGGKVQTSARTARVAQSRCVLLSKAKRPVLLAVISSLRITDEF